jgi:aminoglycoside 6'-N-acetyltransferase
VTGEIILRNATLVDLATLTHWDNQPHVIDSDPNDDWNWEIELTRQVPWREQLIAELNKRPIGFIQIIDPKNEETHYWGDVEENLSSASLPHDSGSP